jgi:hypothetical protein
MLNVVIAYAMQQINPEATITRFWHLINQLLLKCPPPFSFLGTHRIKEFIFKDDHKPLISSYPTIKEKGFI